MVNKLSVECNQLIVGSLVAVIYTLADKFGLSRIWDLLLGLSLPQTSRENRRQYVRISTLCSSVVMTGLIAHPPCRKRIIQSVLSYLA